MIEQKITIDINSGVAPYEYYVETTNSCITITPSSGTTDSNFIEFTATAQSSYCFAEASATLYVVSSDGCNNSIELPLQDICSALTISPISQLNNYKFGVQASSPNCSNLEFQWDYNTALFDLVNVFEGNFTSNIELVPKDGSTFPNTSNIFAQVIDCNNCSASQFFTFNICRPVAQNNAVFLYCSGEGLNNQSYVSEAYTFSTINNCNSVIDFSTISFNLPSNIEAFQDTSNGRPGADVWSFRNVGNLQPGTYTGQWSVKDEYGILSSQGLINIIVSDCNDNQTIYVADKSIQVDCIAVSPGDTIEINIENALALAPNTIVDWSTFEVLPQPIPATGFPNITLGINNTGDRVINYVTPNPIVSDIFAWTVCDTNGNCADATVYTIVGCLTAPVAVDDVDCAVCGQSTTVDVLSNDTSDGPLNISSVEIISAPTNGTALPNALGEIVYTPNAGFEGVDTFTYTVRDTYGNFSNEATVTITTICAGNDVSVSVCNN
jgi:hypothetical protein